jgi:hypothetical protein
MDMPVNETLVSIAGEHPLRQNPWLDGLLCSVYCGSVKYTLLLFGRMLKVVGEDRLCNPTSRNGSLNYEISGRSAYPGSALNTLSSVSALENIIVNQWDEARTS